jgi:hypothetical protein
MSLSRLRVRPGLLFLDAVVGILPAAAAVAADGAPWRFTVTPYLWLPSVSGNSDLTLPRLGSRASESVGLRAETSADSYLDLTLYGPGLGVGFRW